MNSSIIQRFLCFIFCLLGTTVANGQNNTNEKVITIEQKGDSIFCFDKELYFERLNCTFDSCNYSNNNVQVTFQIQNNTKEILFVYREYISWYDSSYLRDSGGIPLILKPNESGIVTLKTVPYSKRRMNSFGELAIRREKAEPLVIPMRFKYESAGVKRCN